MGKKTEIRSPWECPECGTGFKNGYGLVCECPKDSPSQLHGEIPSDPCQAHCMRCGWEGTMPAVVYRPCPTCGGKGKLGEKNG